MTKIKVKLGDLLKVVWLDSCHTEGWFDALEYAKPLQVESIGLLHRDEEDYVMLIMTKDSNGRWSNSISIPKSCIVSQVKLKN